MTPTPAAIAVDAGGSTSRAVVVDHRGDCGPVARAGAGNPVADPGRAARNIADACAQALSTSPHTPHVVVASVAGILSRDFPELSSALAEQGLPTRIVLVSDLLGAYFSGTASPDGSVMILGTGAVAARVLDRRLSTVRDGLGWLLGDTGSGFWMGRRVARAVAANLDGRGPTTSLTPRVLRLIQDVPRRPGVRGADVAALLSWTQSHTPIELAQLAVLAADEAECDEVAGRICTQAAASALGTLASLPGAEEGPVVLGGGVLAPGGPVGRQVHAALGDRFRSVSDGVAGAALLAVAELGGPADEATLARVTASLTR